MVTVAVFDCEGLLIGPVAIMSPVTSRSILARPPSSSSRVS